MIKQIGLFVFLFLSINTFAQEDAKSLIRSLNKKFSLLNDYQANIAMHFQIPGVKMKDMKGKVFFKQPNKFKIKAKGIFFMPKQNPMQNINAMLSDTASYTTVISGYEDVQGRKCAIINIIPLKSENELILGKFWVDILDPLIHKSQITTKNNGTLESYNQYGKYSAYLLPDKITVKVEVNKIKVPKMMAVDLNKKAKAKSDSNQKETGVIEMTFSDFKLNSRFSDEVFTNEKKAID
jgi:hypothetical protein